MFDIFFITKLSIKFTCYKFLALFKFALHLIQTLLWFLGVFVFQLGVFWLGGYHLLENFLTKPSFSQNVPLRLHSQQLFSLYLFSFYKLYEDLLRVLFALPFSLLDLPLNFKDEMLERHFIILILKEFNSRSSDLSFQSDWFFKWDWQFIYSFQKYTFLKDYFQWLKLLSVSIFLKIRKPNP